MENIHRKVCPNGHHFYKSSGCESCPICEMLNKPLDGFLSTIAAPARRALSLKNIDSLDKLSRFTKREIADLHGMGPKAIGILEEVLKKATLTFKD